MTSEKPGLECDAPGWPPDIAPPTKDNANAAAAIAAAMYDTAGSSTVLPFVTPDCTQATSSPFAVFSIIFASPSRSGTLYAIEGILLAYSEGIVCVPTAEKSPFGTM